MRKNYYTPIDDGFNRLLLFLFKQCRWIIFPLTLVGYLLIMFFLSPRIGISSNFFVIIPLIITANCFGFRGGVPAGILALPLNWLIFYLKGRLDFLPDNIYITEVFGIMLGSVVGYLSDYYFRLGNEIQRRRTAETSLRKALKDKDTLLSEIHHRIKNNLNIIKSLIQLQLNRTESEEFIDESRKLIQRIYSISEIHQQLFSHGYTSTLDLQNYITTLVDHIQKSSPHQELRVNFDMENDQIPLPMKQATPLGLIINEVITNIIKYALKEMEDPLIRLSLKEHNEDFLLMICYNGPVFDPAIKTRGLGLKLIKSLTGQLGGTSCYSFEQECCFALTFPKTLKKTNR